MVATAWVMLELLRDRPDAKGDPTSMRGDKHGGSIVGCSMRRGERQKGVVAHENARATRRGMEPHRKIRFLVYATL